MHIECLVEEPSAEAALQNLLPKIIGPTHTFAIHTYNGKHNLLARLPNRLQGYRHYLPDDWRIIVLVDEDRENCRSLKKNLEDIAVKADLATKSTPRGARYQVLNRLAIEELEAWFLGDCEAVRAAFPRISREFGKVARLRNPDAIAGGTWEALQSILQKAGYYRSGIPKIEVARNVSRYMDPAQNRSRSFQVFRTGIQEMIGK